MKRLFKHLFALFNIASKSTSPSEQAVFHWRQERHIKVRSSAAQQQDIFTQVKALGIQCRSIWVNLYEMSDIQKHRFPSKEVTKHSGNATQIKLMALVRVRENRNHIIVFTYTVNKAIVTGRCPPFWLSVFVCIKSSEAFHVTDRFLSGSVYTHVMGNCQNSFYLLWKLFMGCQASLIEG